MTGSFPTSARCLLSLLTTSLLLTSLASAQVQPASGEEQADDGNGAPAALSPAELAKLYTPPTSNDTAAIKSWVETVSQTSSPSNTPAGLREHFGKLEKAADAVMARDIDEAGLIETLRLKVGAVSLLEQLGDTSAPQRKEQLIAKLKQDPRPTVAIHGRLLDVENVINNLQPDDNKTAQQIIDQVTALLQTKPITDSHVSVAYAAAEAIELNTDEQLATTAYNLFAKYLKTSPDPRHASVVQVFEGAARRMNLVGQPVQISGKTLDGKPFNLESCKGKLVLIDFWATWCAPCLEELPRIKALYEKHHAAGFEVVAVNLDDNLGRVSAFLGTQGIKWPQLVSDAGAEHPIANYYGVYQVPTTFLVGRDGKVIATDLFGEDLEEEIERLMTPAQ